MQCTWVAAANDVNSDGAENSYNKGYNDKNNG